MEKAKGNRGNANSIHGEGTMGGNPEEPPIEPPTLSDMGISKKQSSAFFIDGILPSPSQLFDYSLTGNCSVIALTAARVFDAPVEPAKTVTDSLTKSAGMLSNVILSPKSVRLNATNAGVYHCCLSLYLLTQSMIGGKAYER